MSRTIEASGLAFSYDKKRPLLRDITFAVDSDNFVAILGPNGSGKTTLLKVLTGILRPDRGDVRILGRPLNRKTELSGLLAYVPQSLVVDFEIGVLDFVLLGRTRGGGLFGEPGKEDIEEARRSLEILRMGDFERKDLSRLSGGERQKIVIAKALAQETPFVFLDEPTSHLDLRNQIEILEVLRRLSSEGKKIVTILHDVNLAYRYSDQAVLLKDGRIFASGGKEEVLKEDILRDCFDVDVAKVGGVFVPRKSSHF